MPPHWFVMPRACHRFLIDFGISAPRLASIQDREPVCPRSRSTVLHIMETPGQRQNPHDAAASAGSGRAAIHQHLIAGAAGTGQGQLPVRPRRNRQIYAAAADNPHGYHEVRACAVRMSRKCWQHPYHCCQNDIKEMSGMGNQTTLRLPHGHCACIYHNHVQIMARCGRLHSRVNPQTHPDLSGPSPRCHPGCSPASGSQTAGTGPGAA